MEIEQKIPKIRVCIRKRPLTHREIKKKETDIIEIQGDQIIVKEQRQKLDLTKYIENHCFNFDNSFNDQITNLEIYNEVIKPIVYFALNGGKSSCFAYGQTGSGKTYTMIGNHNSPGLYILSAQEIFSFLAQNASFKYQVGISYFEIYCGRLYDLLNDRQELKAREDKKQQICIVGLEKQVVTSVDQIVKMINKGNEKRITSTTGKNLESSRSHAILQFYFIKKKRIKGYINFIDLAGNERGSDTYNHDQQTRFDGAEISKSLLALKECIRALDQDKTHIPFRGSKLTMVLRDSFIGKCKTVMIGTVSPAITNCEYTLNTLRYAARVKELKKEKQNRTQVNDLMLPRDYNKGEDPQMKKSTSLIFLKQNEPQFQNLFSVKDSEQQENPWMFKKKKLDNIDQSKPLFTQNNFKPIFEIEQENEETLRVKHEELINEILQEEEEMILCHRDNLNFFMDSQIKEENMLEEIDKPGSDIEKYVYKMEEILEEKQNAISYFQEKLQNFKKMLKKEQNLSEKAKLIYEKQILPNQNGNPILFQIISTLIT